MASSLDVRGFIEQVNAWASDVFDEAVHDLATELEDRVPVGDTTRLGGDRLRDTREMDVDRFTARLGYTAEHASFTDEGTPPHLIEGNPLLAFEWEGQLVIVRSVMHPGTEGTRWWSDTMEDRRYEEALRDAAERVAF